MVLEYICMNTPLNTPICLLLLLFSQVQGRLPWRCCWERRAKQPTGRWRRRQRCCVFWARCACWDGFSRLRDVRGPHGSLCLSLPCLASPCLIAPGASMGSKQCPHEHPSPRTHRHACNPQRRRRAATPAADGACTFRLLTMGRARHGTIVVS